MKNDLDRSRAEERRFAVVGRLMLDLCHRDIADRITEERVRRLLGELPNPMRRRTGTELRNIMYANRRRASEVGMEAIERLRAAYAEEYPRETAWVTGDLAALRRLRCTEHDSRVTCHLALKAILRRL